MKLLKSEKVISYWNFVSFIVVLTAFQLNRMISELKTNIKTKVLMCMCDWALFAKSILLMDILQLYSFHTDKVAIDGQV